MKENYEDRRMCVFFLFFFFQTSLQNPGIMILRNISFHGSDFAQNISTDLYFYMCLEDFKSVGIEAPLFGTMCFVLVYAIPGKSMRLITNSTRTFRKGETRIDFSIFTTQVSSWCCRTSWWGEHCAPGNRRSIVTVPREAPARNRLVGKKTTSNGFEDRLRGKIV